MVPLNTWTNQNSSSRFIHSMWKIFYNLILLPLTWIGIRVFASFNRKVRRGLRGRKNSLVRMEERLKNKPDENRLWIHASSMGEFEQAKPIIEALKSIAPHITVIASFFSPSGYENNLRYPFADHITYLPFDSRRSIRKFLDVMNPSITAFIRYDLWPNAVWESQRRGIPIILTNATLGKRSTRRFPLIRSFHFSMYNALQSILTVSEDDVRNFEIFHLTKPEIISIGDTRFDRVKANAESARQKRLIPDKILQNKKVLVIGSSWSEDEEVIIPAILKLRENISDMLVLIVPHEPTIEHLDQLEFNLRGRAKCIRFSYLPEYSDESIIIIDSIGILVALYACAQVAFVGGGFKSNVHNVLEPAAYGIPVLYGPKIENSQEASLLQQAGGGYVIRKKTDLYRQLRLFFSDEHARTDAGTKAAEFVNSRTGATEKILEHILPYFKEDI